MDAVGSVHQPSYDCAGAPANHSPAPCLGGQRIFAQAGTSLGNLYEQARRMHRVFRKLRRAPSAAGDALRKKACCLDSGRHQRAAGDQEATRLRVSELTGLTVTRERNELLIKVASDVRTLRQMEDELKKLKEFEERHFWEGGFLPNLPIRRFLPLNFPGLMQRERGGPQGPNGPEGPPGPVCPGPEGPEGPGGPEGPQFPIVLHGPDEEDAWARIGEMEKIDLENPTVRAMLMASNRKFRLYLRVFRCKEAYTPLGSFKRHKYYLLLIKTEQGIPVACFVCPENDHALLAHR